MKIFKFKKDFEQIKQTWARIKVAVKKIEEKFPLFCSITKAIFIIIKWLIILGIIIWIILVIGAIIYHYLVELPKEKIREEQKREEEAREKQYQECLIECNINYPDVGLIWPTDPNRESLLEKRTLRNNCLSSCELLEDIGLPSLPKLPELPKLPNI